ncbi:hypothetical protein ACFQI7_23720 [Paenibacillus allorhizosphaerae]|nr:hypothetical protein [Paenibacillus allorhizosphaerae]
MDVQKTGQRAGFLLSMRAHAASWSIFVVIEKERMSHEVPIP